MTAAARHVADEQARLRREASNPELSDFERESARTKLAQMTAPPGHTSLLDPLTVCRWCRKAIGTHRAGMKPGDLGSSLCPVVRDTSKAGSRSGERLYGPPTSEQVRLWHEANGTKR